MKPSRSGLAFIPLGVTRVGAGAQVSFGSFGLGGGNVGTDWELASDETLITPSKANIK